MLLNCVVLLCVYLEGVLKFVLSGMCMCIYLNLFAGCYGTEDYLCKVLSWKHSETDSTDHMILLDEGQGMMLTVEWGDVVWVNDRMGDHSMEV